MTPQQFREKFSSDTKLTSLSDVKINEALEEAELIVSQTEFGALKERAVGLYAAHILKLETNTTSGQAFSNASSMSIAGQSVSYARSQKDTFYDQSIYGQRYKALKESIPMDDGLNPNRLGIGAFVI